MRPAPLKKEKSIYEILTELARASLTATILLIFISFIYPQNPYIFFLIIFIPILILKKWMDSLRKKIPTNYKINENLFKTIVLTIMLYCMLLLFASTFFYYIIIPRSQNYAIIPDCPQCSAIFQVGNRYYATYYPDLLEPGANIHLGINYCAGECNTCQSCSVSGKVIENGIETYLFKNRSLADGGGIDFSYPGRTVFLEVKDQNATLNFSVPRPDLVSSVVIESKQNPLFAFILILVSLSPLIGFGMYLWNKFIAKKPAQIYKQKTKQKKK